MRLRASSLALVALVAAKSAGAEMAAPPRTEIVHAPAGGGQLALSIRADAGGAVVAATCAASPCSFADAKPVSLPEAFAKPNAGRRAIGPILLERGRHAVVLETFDAGHTTALYTVIVAPLATATDRAPMVAWQGIADLDVAARAPNVLQIRSLVGPARQLVVGERRDDIGLCGGRLALLAPRVLDASDLTFKAAKLMRLTDDELGKASRLVAERRGATRAEPLGRLLTVTGASSAIGSPAAIADGDLETTWSEARGGDGRGEFVTFRVSKDVPLTAMSFVPRPRSREVEGGAAPKRLLVATDDALFAIVLPEDGWQHPGTRYDVRFPIPIATSCVAIVLEEAYVDAGAKSVAVTLAEVEATSAFDEDGDLRSLVGTLSGGDRRARGAAAVLMRGGSNALVAVTEGYSSLDDPGRMLALDVVDQAPCAAAAPLYVRALGGTFEAEVTHARTRIERCRRAAVPALLAALADPAHPARLLAADELSLIAPDDATLALAPLVVADDAKLRKKAREALARAASSERSSAALARVLGGTTLSAAARARVLRVAAARLGDDAAREAASHALADIGATYEERYLVLPAAAVLASRGDEGALALLRGALADTRAPLRAEAARHSAVVPVLAPRLAELARDPEPRVREAIASSLRGGGPALASLVVDEWTFVRAAAYDALAGAPPDGATDALLVQRLAADSADVALVHAIDATARRKIGAAAATLRSLASDGKRALDVRARALAALGGVCDRGAVELLTEVARRGAAPTAPAEDQALAGAAIAALGALHPPDLAARLGPLTSEGAPAAKSAARAALEDKSICPLRPRRKSARPKQRESPSDFCRGRLRRGAPRTPWYVSAPPGPRSAKSAGLSELPERDAAEEPGDVRGDLHVLGQLALDQARISAAEVDDVRVEDRLNHREDLAHALAPTLLPAALERGVADQLFVRLLPAERVVRELEVRHVMAVDEERAAHPRAEGEHHLDALAAHDAVALHARVVEHANRLAGGLRERRAERKAGPAVVEVRRRPHDVRFHDAREADRDAVERRRVDDHRAEGGEHGVGRRGARRRDAPALALFATGCVEHDRLEPGSADVDAERMRPRRGALRPPLRPVFRLRPRPTRRLSRHGRSFQRFLAAGKASGPFACHPVAPRIDPFP